MSVLREVALLAQTAQPTDVTGDLPSGTWLLVLIGVGLAIYISYKLGPERTDSAPKRREGPVSRALSLRSSDHDEG